MAEWTRLGGTALRDLVNTAIDNRELLVAVASARRKLNAWLPLVRLHQGVNADIGDNPVAAVAWSLRPLPSADLDRAVAELGRLGALHARAGRAFALYRQGVGLDGDDAESLQHAQLVRSDAAAAPRRLRVAAAMARAFEDAIRSARAFPHESPEFTAWMEAAYKLASHAVVTCTMVLRSARRMRDSTGREFNCVRTVLYGPYVPPPGCLVM